MEKDDRVADEKERLWKFYQFWQMDWIDCACEWLKMDYCQALIPPSRLYTSLNPLLRIKTQTLTERRPLRQ